MTSFRTATRYPFLEQKSYFCPHIAECANIPECANIAEKTFVNIALPCVSTVFEYILKNRRSQLGIIIFGGTLI